MAMIRNPPPPTRRRTAITREGAKRRPIRPERIEAMLLAADPTAAIIPRCDTDSENSFSNSSGVTVIPMPRNRAMVMNDIGNIPSQSLRRPLDRSDSMVALA